jgi:hypothetical protein
MGGRQALFRESNRIRVILPAVLFGELSESRGLWDVGSLNDVGNQVVTRGLSNKVA